MTKIFVALMLLAFTACGTEPAQSTANDYGPGRGLSDVKSPLVRPAVPANVVDRCGIGGSKCHGEVSQ
jgi:hypothetical protein